MAKKRNLYKFFFFNFAVTPSIISGHFKVLKHFLPKHLKDSWNLGDGFINVGNEKSLDQSQTFLIFKSILEIPGISENFDLKCFIN